MNAPVIAYFDGLCEPTNPGGYACGGFDIDPCVIPDARVLEGHACFGHGQGWTNNRAEYEAALLCLRAIYKAGWRGPVVLRGDSQLVVKQFNGSYACHSETLAPLLAQLRKAATFFASVTLEWVPREQNTDADRESRHAYLEATGRQAPERRKESA